MKKLISLIFLLACVLVSGAEEVQHYAVNVGNFSSLLVIDNVNVEYRCNADSAGYAVFDTTPYYANNVIFSNSSNKLKIEVVSDIVPCDSMPTFVVYSRSLESVVNDGTGKVVVGRLPQCNRFKASLSDNGALALRHVDADEINLNILTGKGTIVAVGNCGILKTRLVGAGVINTNDVTSPTVECKIMGTGQIFCNVIGGELKVMGTGTGKVYYKGKPSKVTVRKIGSIKAIPQD